jgi:hypothetical protein
MTKRTIQIDEDLDFQRREWLGQRIGMALVLLFVLAALLGFTGVGGPISHGEAGQRGDPLHVEYDRFVRRGAIATMKLHLRSGEDGRAQFWVAAPYLERIRVEAVTPEPESVSVDPARHVYTIHRASGDVTVVFQVEHKTMGRIDAEIGLVGGPTARFSQISLF